LAATRSRQFLHWAIKHDLREGKSQRSIRPLKQFSRGRIIFRKIPAHAHRLGTLTGKEESNFFAHSSFP
jgi:hypothetical protein